MEYNVILTPVYEPTSHKFLFAGSYEECEKFCENYGELGWDKLTICHMIMVPRWVTDKEYL